MGYAEQTSVPVSRSRAEIEDVLNKHGATRIVSGLDAVTGGGIMFEYKSRAIKLGVPYPKREKYADNTTGTKHYEQEIRRRWRVLLIALKAKLEMVEIGLSSFEDEFLAQTCLPGNITVGQWIQPQIVECIESNQMPKALLPGF